jgi:hypothetical protein
VQRKRPKDAPKPTATGRTTQSTPSTGWRRKRPRARLALPSTSCSSAQTRGASGSKTSTNPPPAVGARTRRRRTTTGAATWEPRSAAASAGAYGGCTWCNGSTRRTKDRTCVPRTPRRRCSRPLTTRPGCRGRGCRDAQRLRRRRRLEAPRFFWSAAQKSFSL